jgi:hypothetical protein
MSIVTVDQFARLFLTFRNGTKECILRWVNPRERGKRKRSRQVHGRQGLEGQTKRLAFSPSLHPGRRYRRLMNIQIVRSWHPALCLCPSFTDGFRHGLVFSQPLFAAAVLLSQRRPVSSWTLHLPSTSALRCAANPPCSVGAGVFRLDRAFIAAWSTVLARAPTPAGSKCIISRTGSAGSVRS